MLLDMQVWILPMQNSSNITDISGIYETQTAFNISLIAKKIPTDWDASSSSLLKLKEKHNRLSF
jgi:hypothetical protein